MFVSPTLKNKSPLGYVLERTNYQKGINLDDANLFRGFGASASPIVDYYYLTNPITGQRYFMAGFSVVAGDDQVTK